METARKGYPAMRSASRREAGRPSTIGTRFHWEGVMTNQYRKSCCILVVCIERQIEREITFFLDLGFEGSIEAVLKSRVVNHVLDGTRVGDLVKGNPSRLLRERVGDSSSTGSR